VIIDLNAQFNRGHTEKFVDVLHDLDVDVHAVVFLERSGTHGQSSATVSTRTWSPTRRYPSRSLSCQTHLSKSRFDRVS